MKLTEVVILGILNRARRHGYEIKKEIESEMRNVDVQFGSIYHALKKFTKQGFIQEVAIPPSEPGRPDRKGYAITDTGRAHLDQLLRDALSFTTYTGDALDAAIHFLSMLPRADVIALLEERLTTLQTTREQLDTKATRRAEEVLSQVQSRKPSYLSEAEASFLQAEQENIPALIRMALKRQQYYLDAEIRWVQDTLTTLTDMA